LVTALNNAVKSGKVLDVSKLQPNGTGYRIVDIPKTSKGKKRWVDNYPVISNNYDSYALAMKILGPEYEQFAIKYLQMFGSTPVVKVQKVVEHKPIPIPANSPRMITIPPGAAFPFGKKTPVRVSTPKSPVIIPTQPNIPRLQPISSTLRKSPPRILIPTTPTVRQIPTVQMRQSSPRMAVPTVPMRQSSPRMAVPTVPMRQSPPRMVVPTIPTVQMRQSSPRMAVPTVQMRQSPPRMAIPTVPMRQSPPRMAVPTIPTVQMRQSPPRMTVPMRQSPPRITVPTIPIIGTPEKNNYMY
jgi:hypothetical protein